MPATFLYNDRSGTDVCDILQRINIFNWLVCPLTMFNPLSMAPFSLHKLENYK